MDSPRISIVIPVYNAAKDQNLMFLVDSLNLQTVNNFEVIFCNDGSDDNTSELLENIIQKNSCFKALNLEHHGVSHARNKGIEAAIGKWITFIDADDIIAPDFVESFMQYDGEYDLLCCGYAIISNSIPTFKNYSHAIYNGIDNLNCLLGNTEFLHRCSPWSKCFRHKTLIDNNIRFNECLSHSEDRLFFYNYLLFTNVIVTIPKILYFYSCLSATSLKHKHHPIDMLYRRQSLMTKNAIKLCQQYNLNKFQRKYIYINLANLVKDSISSIYVDFGYSHKTLRIQQDFLNEFLNNLKQLDSLREYIKMIMSSDKEIQFIVNNKLKKLDRYYLSLKIKISISKLINKISRRKGKHTLLGESFRLINNEYYTGCSNQV